MDKKTYYLAPYAEILAVKFERNFCESPTDTNEPYNPTTPIGGFGQD